MLRIYFFLRNNVCLGYDISYLSYESYDIKKKYLKDRFLYLIGSFNLIFLFILI